MPKKNIPLFKQNSWKSKLSVLDVSRRADLHTMNFFLIRKLWMICYCLPKVLLIRALAVILAVGRHLQWLASVAATMISAQPLGPPFPDELLRWAQPGCCHQMMEAFDLIACLSFVIWRFISKWPKGQERCVMMIILWCCQRHLLSSSSCGVVVETWGVCQCHSWVIHSSSILFAKLKLGFLLTRRGGFIERYSVDWHCTVECDHLLLEA